MRVVYSCKYRAKARLVIDEVIRIFGNAENYKDQVWGKKVYKEEILEICEQYLAKNKLDVRVFFGTALVTTMSAKGLSLLDTYRDLRLVSLLDHEIGTHHVRSLNQKNMDESIKSSIKDSRIGWQLATEEGLASLGNHLHYGKCSLQYIPALLYYAVCLAQEGSFWDTFKGLQKYVTDFDHCWLQTIRVKRGIADTSRPGAFCKDQCSFDGSLRILEQRNSIAWHALYAGKVSIETYNLCEGALKRAA